MFSMFLLGDATVEIPKEDLKKIKNEGKQPVENYAASDTTKEGMRGIRLIISVENAPVEMESQSSGIDKSFSPVTTAYLRFIRNP